MKADFQNSHSAYDRYFPNLSGLFSKKNPTPPCIYFYMKYRRCAISGIAEVTIYMNCDFNKLLYALCVVKKSQIFVFLTL